MVRLLPEDRDAASEVWFMDRFFDKHVMTAMQKPVLGVLSPEGGRKQAAMAEAWKWRGVPVWSHNGLICTGGA